MKKITKKAINSALPNIAIIRSRYILHGTLGWVKDSAQTLDAVYLTQYSDGAVSITYYAVGEPRYKYHYYCKGKYDDGDGRTTYDITRYFENWFKGEYDRKELVNIIYDKVNNDNFDWELYR